MAQTFDVARFLKSAFAGLAPDEALRQPPGVLLGVSAGAQAALETLGVRTVFDLAASRVFATARALLAIQQDPTTAEARLNAVAADAVDAPAGVPVTELADQPIAILRGVGSANAPALGAALDVATVRDLALWPAARGRPSDRRTGLRSRAGAGVRSRRAGGPPAEVGCLSDGAHLLSKAPPRHGRRARAGRAGDRDGRTDRSDHGVRDAGGLPTPGHGRTAQLQPVLVRAGPDARAAPPLAPRWPPARARGSR